MGPFRKRHCTRNPQHRVEIDAFNTRVDNFMAGVEASLAN